MTLRPAPLLALTLLLSAPARGFDYLEHSYLSDRACHLAQQRLTPLLAAGDDALAARYLALSLSCPEAWARPYCADGYKQLEGSLNRLERPPADSHDHPVTFGDFSALPDHLTQFGQVRGFPQTAKEGLVTRLLEWLAGTGDAGGVVSDVAEDACETDEPLRWASLDGEAPSALQLPAPPASPVERAPARKVEGEPAAAYSFDNPQYLDMVLQNHGHFGPAAYRNWAGFHAAAADLARAPCESVIPLDDDLLEELSEGLAGFEALDWDRLEGAALAAKGCEVVAERVRLRALEWGRRGSRELVAPARPLLDRLAAPASEARSALARSLVTPLLSLVFEGAGLHYLQDGLSSGHVRVERLAYDLYESRYQHDADSANGLAARVSTAAGSEELVLFGDGYVLGAEPEPLDCAPRPLDPARVTACLLKRQRARILASSAASILHWSGSDADFVRSHLPVAATGAPPPPVEGGEVMRSALPTPPPPFSYQSILLSTSADAAGGSPQVGIRTVFLTELDSRANWMTSYHVGLLTRLGQGEQSQLTAELSYMFHWRWAARFLINAGPYAYAGLGGFGEAVHPFAGVGPSLGTSVLPEGWIRLPLEVTLSYRLPLRLLDGRVPLARQRVRVDAHWIELAVGLAFM